MDHSLERYSRQILFQHIGEERQKVLMNSTAIVIGCGALGTVSSSYLVRAGIGHLRIIDRDFIEESNLQRQILFDENDITENLPKAVAAQRKLQKINSEINIEGIVTDINYSNIGEIAEDADIIIDGTDNFETRFLINDYCIKYNIPWIYGACIESKGLVMNIIPSVTPCLRCVFEMIPQIGTFPTCDTAGVIGPIAAIIAAIQVAEAIKILTKDYDFVNKKLQEFDVWNTKFKQLDISELIETDNCPTCKLHNYKFLEAEEGVMATFLCGKNAVQVMARNADNIDLAELEHRLETIVDVSRNAFMLSFTVKDHKFTVFPDGRAIITGTADTSAAKNLYSKYIGM
ncbi:dinucleotide-utilizing enzyme family 2 [Candidatus Scalindua japonica]|uniref:Dinucleotide-utilizing enzyme family 2 n=1 Tax=Candidatus Scalindua japonica TaxID=1284222 RepID=A0A286TVA0_9BACT|nr:ThiF family adenylyltransferase [Candidatus Scalindua japonica]GAX59771.1 dinucleotide-utilizing enzyme family 2 [Candidatus Scalindua japonica]